MSEAATRFGLAAWGVVRIPWAEVPTWRRNPGPADGLKPGPLKLADEQTVLGMAAVLRACDRFGLPPAGFGQWGVLAAPRFLGRLRLVQAISRYRKLGIKSLSPLLIPNQTQHAVAGTTSLILGSHGPSFGVGGGPNAIGELMLNATGILRDGGCPGVWVVMTAWNPEPVPVEDSAMTFTPTVGIGVALALTPNEEAGTVCLRPAEVDGEAVGSAVDVADGLEATASGAVWRCGIPGVGYLEVTPGAAVERLPLRRAG